MIKHIVFWTLHDEALGHSASDNAALVKSRLESLAGQIPGLLHIEVGLDISDSESSADVALYSEFEDLAALQAYQTHPRTRPWLTSWATSGRVAWWSTTRPELQPAT